MNKKTAPSLSIKTVFFFVIIISVSFIVLSAFWPPAYRSLWEAVIALFLFLILVNIKCVRDFLGGMPKPHKAIFLVFLALMMLGQYIHKPQGTFPFLPWDMFGKKYGIDVMHYMEYFGIDRSGRKIQFFPEEVFPVVGRSRFGVNIDRRGIELMYRKKHPGPLPDLAEIKEETRPKGKFKGIKTLVRAVFRENDYELWRADVYEDLLVMLGEKYNEDHPNDPFVGLETYYCEIDLDYKSGLKISKELLWTVSLDDKR